MSRDFTYIYYLVQEIFLLIGVPPRNVNERKKEYKNNSISGVAPWKVVIIGDSKSIKLLAFIYLIEKKIGRKVKKFFKDSSWGCSSSFMQ